MKIVSRGRGVYDITQHVDELVRASGAQRGLILAFSADPLCRLITIEYDPDLIADLLELIGSLKAKNPYVVASIFQPSIVIPFEGGLRLGAFQQVCLLDLNESPGERSLLLEVIT